MKLLCRWRGHRWKTWFSCHVAGCARTFGICTRCRTIRTSLAADCQTWYTPPFLVAAVHGNERARVSVEIGAVDNATEAITALLDALRRRRPAGLGADFI